MTASFLSAAIGAYTFGLLGIPAIAAISVASFLGTAFWKSITIPLPNMNERNGNNAENPRPERNVPGPIHPQFNIRNRADHRAQREAETWLNNNRPRVQS